MAISMGLKFGWFTDIFRTFSLDVKDTNRFPVPPACFLRHFWLLQTYIRLGQILSFFMLNFEVRNTVNCSISVEGISDSYMFDVKQPFQFHPGEILVESRVLNHRSSLIRPTLMKPPLLKGAYWRLVDIDGSALNFSWSAVFPTPLESVRHAPCRSQKF